ncbi:DUF2093 domain-containing protein [Sphingobium sp. BYY-5]|uniref:DUF2093 domain-containing protein n=1 Tax=Sphingobium sp. BYY-5 TaxID=2926400 RepID=UPI001FA702D5|nr:DUF2093 domain-containing protein [Sphingobium sp. BYY-5]MCI4590917.1 DUF2093 domain-containing protein [Sphingobium sp. BYY-5]
MLMSNRERVARLHYMPYSFRVLQAGDHVVCAVSGARIPLEELRYWSIARQEPYASAQASAQAELKAGRVG